MSGRESKPAPTLAEVEDLLNGRKNVDPVPILTHRAESRVTGELRMVAIVGCGDKVRDLAKCAEGRTFSVVWYCRQFNRAVQTCMKEYKADESLKDEMRRRYEIILSIFT